ANFLRIGVGARAVAMGEAHTAVANDAYAPAWNPAGLAQVVQKEAAFMHAQLVEGLQYEYGALALPLRRGTLGLSGGYFSTGDIDGFDKTGVSLGTLTRSFDATGSLSYGLRVGEDVAVGVTGRYLYKRLVNRTASTVAGDLGLQYHTPLEGLALGVVVQHLGGKLKFIQDSDPLPRTLKLGAAYQYRWALVALDWQHPRDQDAFVTAGVELRPIKWLALRGGWKAKDEVGPGFRAGAGVTLKQTITLDYAFLPFGAFGDTHRLSLTVRWGTSSQATAVSTASALQPSSSQPPSPATISTQTLIPPPLPSTTMTEPKRLLLRDIP
ncbi:MAG: PorV/PorQ family protein, partial [Elusimicrobia bacterium]|nr:PorV/PorQ family protein [Elusimicrobiota bacterium]